MLTKIFSKLIHIGVTASHTKIEAQKLKLVNLLAFVPLPLYLISTAYSFMFNYPRILYLNLFAAISMIVIFICNHLHKYTAAKTIFLCATSLVILVYYKLMGNEVSMFYYFFPLILCFILFYKPKEEKSALFFTAFFMGICILLTLYLPASYFEPWPLPNHVHVLISRVNGIGCTIMIIIYAYNIFITNAKQEQILIKSKELAEAAAKAKTVFLSNMSHELRTPLNGIVGTANILDVKDTENVQHHVQVMKNLAEHMMGLVNNVLDFSKIDSGKLELHNAPINMGKQMAKMHDLFYYQCKEKNIKFVEKIDEKLSEIIVYSDDLRLQQIFNNLISNAIKFTENGDVVLQATLIEHNDDFVNILFNVVDNGIGIEMDKLNFIFESFNQGDTATTRKYGGTGLGLSIASNLVKLFGSELHVNSTLDKGSDFFFTIKFPLYKNGNSTNNFEVVGNKLMNKRILVAEDNPINMLVAKKILQKWGVIVDEAANGIFALQKCKEKQFDLLLLDLEMPEMDGKTALKEIRQLQITTPAMAFTAAMYENMETDLLQSGFVTHALKPFKPEYLYKKIVSVLES
jgi:signal transduction histidine kinase/CheY-like chemotaxis protein